MTHSSWRADSESTTGFSSRHSYRPRSKDKVSKPKTPPNFWRTFGELFQPRLSSSANSASTLRFLLISSTPACHLFTNPHRMTVFPWFLCFRWKFRRSPLTSTKLPRSNRPGPWPHHPGPAARCPTPRSSAPPCVVVKAGAPILPCEGIGTAAAS